MRRRISLFIASALVGVAVLPASGAAASGGGLNENATLRCLVNLQLDAERTADISTEAAVTITELSDNLTCGTLRDFDGVEELSSLRVLEVTNADFTTLTDLSPLGELFLLEQLTISPAAGVTDLTPLRGLPNLGSISLTGARVGDASVLAELPRLRSLTFDYAPNLDITTLAALDQVRDLTFVNMPYPLEAGSEMDLTGVGGMADLASLEVRYSFLTNLAPLATATGLTRLTLSRNRISDVSPLASLTSLQSLSLNENDIDDISPLRSLTALTTLDLSWNDISDLSPMVDMAELTALNLNKNGVVDVSPLSGLHRVEQLNLSNNSIMDASPLGGMAAVRTANLGYNQIDDITGLARWTRAEDIFVADNAIADLRLLKDLKADVRASRQIARVPDGTTIDRVAPIRNKQSHLCPLHLDRGGNAAWDCGDGKFSGQVRTVSGGVPGPAPTPSATPTPDTPAPPTPTPSRKPTQGPPPLPKLPFSVYNTPGQHTVNGRLWKTACEPYSQTWRCRTEIWGTTVSVQDGRFVARNGWSFNNLTYLPSPRAMWAGNPLGEKKSWTAADGRTWRTECNTALTGRNGCRTWVTSRVIRNLAKPGSPVRYGWDSVEVFNNMVQFG